MVSIDKMVRLIERDERSLYKLAKDADLDYALLHRLVNDKVKRNIWLETAFKLADALGIDVNEFRSDDQ